MFTYFCFCFYRMMHKIIIIILHNMNFGILPITFKHWYSFSLPIQCTMFYILLYVICVHLNNNNNNNSHQQKKKYTGILIFGNIIEHLLSHEYVRVQIICWIFWFTTSVPLRHLLWFNVPNHHYCDQPTYIHTYTM